MTVDWPGEEDGHLSTGDLLAEWLIRTAGSPLTGRAWRLTDPLDRGSRFVEAAPPAPCTVIGEPRAGGQAAVARGVVSGYGDPVAIRLMLASTDPKAQQRERLQVGIGQLSRSHQDLLPALVRTVESFLMSVPAANFYNSQRQLQPGSSTVEVWVHVLEWCPQTLADELLASGGRGLGAEAVVRGMLPVIRTLHGMHELGYIHRDLDPSNILVAEDGGLRVADFGIAVQMRAEHTHTMTEAWGKPGRMPPEALDGQHVPVGPAYDAWQAGFLIAEAATGSRPVLPGGGLSPRLNDLPKPVRAVVRELLEPDRAKRLPLDRAIERLGEWLNGVEIAHRPIPQKQAKRPVAPTYRVVARSVALPAVFLALLGVLAIGRMATFTSSESTSRSVSLTLAEQELLSGLQTERGVSAAILSGNAGFQSELSRPRDLVDQQIAVVRQAAESASDSILKRNSLAALNALKTLPRARRAIDNRKADRSYTLAYFTSTISLLSQSELGGGQEDDQVLRGNAATLQALREATESVSQQRAFLTGVFSAGGFRPGEFVQFAQMRADEASALQRFKQLATPEQLDSLDFIQQTGASQTVSLFRQVALDAADGHPIVVNPQSWWSSHSSVLDDLYQLQLHIASKVQLRAYELHRKSTLELIVLIVLASVCVVASLFRFVRWARNQWRSSPTPGLPLSPY